MQYSTYSEEPHDLTRRLVSGFDSMPPSERRVILQALPLSDLTHLAHLLAAQRPHSYRNPDMAWKWLRLCIEPMEWEIRVDRWQDGDHYVAFFADQALMSRPQTPDDFTQLCQDMNSWFDTLYPRNLIDAYTQPLEASHGAHAYS